MEAYYPFIVFIGLIALTIVGRILRGIARQKGEERSARRSAEHTHEARLAMKPRSVTLADAITVGFPADRTGQILTASKLVKPQPDGTWTNTSAFSKEHKFIVGIQDHGPNTTVEVKQFLSKNDSLDNDMIWEAIAVRIHKEAKKVAASFSYEPGSIFQIQELEKNVLLHRR